MRIVSILLVVVGGLICFLAKPLLKALKVRADEADMERYMVYTKMIGFFVAAFGALIIFMKG